LFSDRKATYLISVLSVWAAICCSWYWESIIGLSEKDEKTQPVRNDEEQGGKIFERSFTTKAEYRKPRDIKFRGKFQLQASRIAAQIATHRQPQPRKVRIQAFSHLTTSMIPLHK
jgi:hypothetical protein